MFSLITLLEFISVSTANVVSEVHHPNVIIVHVENLVIILSSFKI